MQDCSNSSAYALDLLQSCIKLWRSSSDSCWKQTWSSNFVSLATYFTLPSQYNDLIMGAIASQITSITIVYLTVYSDADERKHQSSTPLAFVWGIHRWSVNSPHKYRNAENVSIWWRHHDHQQFSPLRGRWCNDWPNRSQFNLNRMYLWDISNVIQRSSWQSFKRFRRLNIHHRRRLTCIYIEDDEKYCHQTGSFDFKVDSQHSYVWRSPLSGDPFYWHEFTLISAWISNYTHFKMCDELQRRKFGNESVFSSHTLSRVWLFYPC